ncbi:hypothetical protein [Thiolinea disciformis]|uniref:hypothetical protein n=1 Tax=Thiolinea disciformis TaxID=125614 RepID=UPI00037F6F36|nr:hypothetical protein [Thiolinea disciformis]
MSLLKWTLALALCLPVAFQAEAGSKAHKSHKASKHPVKTLQVAKLAGVPTRGMSMKQVSKRYGKPASVRVSKGPVKKRWPRITEWNYGKYSVYFEKQTVLHTVMH